MWTLVALVLGTTFVAAILGASDNRDPVPYEPLRVPCPECGSKQCEERSGKMILDPATEHFRKTSNIPVPPDAVGAHVYWDCPDCGGRGDGQISWVGPGHRRVLHWSKKGA